MAVNYVDVPARIRSPSFFLDPSCVHLGPCPSPGKRSNGGEENSINEALVPTCFRTPLRVLKGRFLCFSYCFFSFFCFLNNGICTYSTCFRPSLSTPFYCTFLFICAFLLKVTGHQTALKYFGSPLFSILLHFSRAFQ